MKPTTRVNDIRAILAAANAEAIAAEASRSLAEATTHAAADHLHRLVGEVVETRAAAADATEATKRIPAPRRTLAAASVRWTQDYASQMLRGITVDYSGETRREITWGERPDASTTVSKGDKYSRTCTYRKTDATHRIVLAAEGIPALYDARSTVVAASAYDHLPLISLRQDGRATWVRAAGKRVTTESGWVAYDPAERVCYHSTRSRAHATEGLGRKVAAIRRDREQRDLRRQQDAARAADARKAERRARLVVRLAGDSVVATTDDARAEGYCEPGIEAFRQRHGIGETATLATLVATGDPRAVALAMSVARRAHRGAIVSA